MKSTSSLSICMMWKSLCEQRAMTWCWNSSYEIKKRALHLRNAKLNFHLPAWIFQYRASAGLGSLWIIEEVITNANKHGSFRHAISTFWHAKCFTKQIQYSDLNWEAIEAFSSTFYDSKAFSRVSEWFDGKFYTFLHFKCHSFCVHNA